jgi:hypothetical protein
MSLSDFDKCVLEHMPGVTSDLAASSVKEACIRTVETLLPTEALLTLRNARAAFGQLPHYEGGFGLYMTLNNNSGYTITELSIEIVNKQNPGGILYAIRNFPFIPPPGTFAMGPSEDDPARAA